MLILLKKVQASRFKKNLIHFKSFYPRLLIIFSSLGFFKMSSKEILKPLYEKGDLVSFTGYKARTFNYLEHKKTWKHQISDLFCPVWSDSSIFLVLVPIPAEQLFTKKTLKHLSEDDNGYIVVSQLDGLRYFVYEDELTFL